MVRSGARRRWRARGDGYNLVILMVMVTVMNVLVAVALPVWSQAAQRQKEEELVFRGLQYAEAIRVFQVRNGRYPTQLVELLEVEPRAIRQLWTDPFRDDGKWGLVLAGQQQGQQIGSDAQQGSAPDRGRPDRGRAIPVDEEGKPIVPTEDVSKEGRRAAGLSGQVVTTGPILGVRSITKKEAVKTFLGSNSTEDWEFVADLIPILPSAPGVDSFPRLTSRYIGRPFPPGLEPELGGALDGDAGEDARSNPSRTNRQSRPERPNRPGQSNSRSRGGRG